MRAAEMVVKRVMDQGFLEQVREVGAYLLERLAEINSPHITDVRGRGLMAGIELDIPPAGVVS